MEISLDWLKEVSACSEGKDWFAAQKETDGVKVLKKLLKEDHWDWANWTIYRMFTKEQKIQYAIFAAEQVISIFEKKYPDDKRPREAIKAARAYLKDPSEKNKKATYAAANAANAATYAANAATYAAANAANAAANAAYAAANAAAYAAANAANAAANAAAYAAANAATYAAANAAANAANAANAAMKKKIIEYGISLVEAKC